MNEDTINLVKRDGKIYQVVTHEVQNEVPYDADEIRRQIKQHTDVLERLERELAAVEGFDDKDQDTLEARTVTLEAVATPILDHAVVEEIVKDIKETSDGN